MRADAALLAAGTGAFAAMLQFAGALKSLPGLAALPLDLTLLAALLLLPSLTLLLLARDWEVGRGLALPLLGVAALLVWLVLAGTWSGSRLVLAEKLPQVVLLGPAMLLAGLLVGGDAPTLRRFAGAVVGIGLLVGAGVAWGLATDQVVLGGAVGADPGRTRVQYQLAGLAIACAGGLAALRLAEARGLGRAGWALALLALAAASLVPGGRAAALGLGLGVAGAPALRFWLLRRPGAAIGWLGGIALAGAGGLALLLAAPGDLAALRTLDRLFGDPTEATPARVILWGEALRWAGIAAPFGLGTGGFTLAAGSGDDRGLHPHNHALEVLAEAGLPGLMFWLLAFGGAVVLALARAGRVAPGRAARIAALTLPVALTAMVSTDLGNRMVWFALGLLLSLAVLAALGRPVLFRQERAGRGGRCFTLLKFRSMAAGEAPDAARLGRFGRALRASALDELPQLLNVLRGEMSLVGPRPLPAAYTALYSPGQEQRLRVRPGLAGLAQAAGRNALPWPARLALDARYAARQTLGGDLRLILRCGMLVLRGHGTTAPGHATMPAFRGEAE